MEWPKTTGVVFFFVGLLLCFSGHCSCLYKIKYILIQFNKIASRSCNSLSYSNSILKESSLTGSPYFTTHSIINFIDSIDQSFWRYKSRDLIELRFYHSDNFQWRVHMRSPSNSVYKNIVTMKAIFDSFFWLIFWSHGWSLLQNFLTFYRKKILIKIHNIYIFIEYTYPYKSVYR